MRACTLCQSAHLQSQGMQYILGGRDNLHVDCLKLQRNILAHNYGLKSLRSLLQRQFEWKLLEEFVRFRHSRFRTKDGNYSLFMGQPMTK